jgi:hypothetical protein
MNPMDKYMLEQVLRANRSPNPVVFQAGCHAFHPVVLRARSEAEPTLEVQCATCDRPVVVLRIRVPLSHDLRQAPCHRRGIQIRYALGSGVLEVICWKCERVVRTIALQEVAHA